MSSGPPDSGSGEEVEPDRTESAAVGIDITEGTEGDQFRRMGRGGALSILGSAGSSVLAFAITLVLTRGLGAEGSGEIFQAIALFNILYFSFNLGTRTGLVRYVAAAPTLMRASELKPLLWISVAPVAIVSAVGSAAMFILADRIAGWMASDGQPQVLAGILRTQAPFVALAAVGLAYLSATRGFAVQWPTVWTERLGRPALQLLLVVVVFAAGYGAVAASIAWVVPFGLSLIPSVLAMRWLTRKRWPHDQPTRTRPIAQIAREFWSFTLPQAVAGILQITVRWSDTILVGALNATRSAAVYTAATRLLILGSTVNLAIIQTTQAPVSSALARGDRRRAHDLYAMATTWLVVFVWPLYIVCFVFAPVVLDIFDPGFSEGAGALRILSGAMLAASAIGPVEAILLMGGMSRVSLAVNALALAVNLALNLYLIPRMGMQGAALSWAAALFVTNVIPLVVVWKRMALHPWQRPSLWALGVNLVCVAAPCAVIRVVMGPTPSALVTALAVSGLAFGTALARLRRKLHLDLLAGAVLRRSRKGLDEAGTDEAPLE